jgi:hypothetical protein
MNRWDVINHLIRKNKYTRYLEIGYGTGENYNRILLNDKTSVDIGNGVNPGDTGCNYLMSSCDFFSKAKKSNFNKYDIIFIDGSHVSKDVIQDIQNSLDLLSENGSIVCHDCNPEKELYQIVPYVAGSPKWNGDVWKAWLKIRTTRSDLKMYVVDTDEGCGVIRYGSQELFRMKDAEVIDYGFFDNNRRDILNLISAKDFKEND